VLDAVTSAHSRRSYELALDGFFSWWEHERRPPFTKAAVQAFRAKLESEGLAGTTINVRLSAIRRLAAEAADNGLLDPEPRDKISLYQRFVSSFGHRQAKRDHRRGTLAGPAPRDRLQNAWDIWL
jgi:site-specific recombinase XerD